MIHMSIYSFESVFLHRKNKKKLRQRFFSTYSQLTFTCSKLTIETLEKGAKYVES